VPVRATSTGAPSIASWNAARHILAAAIVQAGKRAVGANDT
jgi:hypothetical protein